jgi:hypothetical protein
VGFTDSGLRLSKHFLLFYELLTGTLPFKIMGGDRPHALASALLRTLPEADTAVSLYGSILRILDRYPQLSALPDIPKYEQHSRLEGVKNLFNRSDNWPSFLKSVVAFFQSQFGLDGSRALVRFELRPKCAESEWLLSDRQGSKHPRELLSPASKTYERW